MVDLKGDIITFTVESKDEIAKKISEVDAHIEAANRVYERM